MGLTSRAKGGVAGSFLLAAFLVTISFFPLDRAAAAEVENLSPFPAVSKVSGRKGTVSVHFRQPASVESYWTRQRMLSALPADEPLPRDALAYRREGDATSSAASGDFIPGRVSEFPQRVHGRVFFTLNNQNYGCSGTIVSSAERDLMFTAAHCLYDETAKRYVDNLAFVPAYDNGNAPYGKFTLKSGSVPRKWIETFSHSYDIAAVKLDSPLEKTLGARQIAFDLNPMVSKKKRREYTIYGYPSSPTELFDGETLRGCRSAFRQFDGSDPNVVPYPMAASPCNMGHGASGGGWITLGNYLNSVVSYGHCEVPDDTCGSIFGPYFSNAAKALYEWAGGSPAPTMKLLRAPPKIVRKRKVVFRFSSIAATLVGYRCRLDRQKAVGCSASISINQLRPGKHTLRVWAVDQTGHASRKKVIRSFRVILPRR